MQRCLQELKYHHRIGYQRVGKYDAVVQWQFSKKHLSRCAMKYHWTVGLSPGLQPVWSCLNKLRRDHTVSSHAILGTCWLFAIAMPMLC